MNLPYPILFLLITLAVYRLAQLIALDDISKPIRTFAGKRAGNSKIWKFIANLLHCPYCMGIWFAFAGAWILQPDSLLSFIVIWLSLAGGQAFLESLSSHEAT